MKSVRTSDITKNELPKNRTEVFFDCIKLRPLVFFKTGIIVFLGFMPFLIIDFLREATVIKVFAAVSDGALAAENAERMIRSYMTLFSLFDILSFIIAGVMLAGATRVISRLVWSEGVFFMQDLADGVRSNGLFFAVIGLIAGLFTFLFTAAQGAGEFYDKALVAIKYAAAILFAPIAIFALMETVIYKLGAFAKIKNAAVLYLKTLPTTLLMLAAIVAPYYLCYIGNMLVRYVALSVFLLFFAPMLLAGAFLYSSYVFDKFINKDHFPELYDRGVLGRREEKENQ